ncbi:MAG: SNF2-related protein [Planctomycetaceae bacterium]
MTLAELLEKQFRPDLRFRGDGYYADDRVAIRRVTPDRVYGVVRDGVDYQTQLDRADGKLGKHCTCEQFAKLGVCKHLWATIRAIDGAKLLSGASKPGYLPPFMSDEPVYAGPEAWADDGDDEDFDPSELIAARLLPRRNGGQAAVAPVVQRKPKLRPWEQALQSLREDLEENQIAAAGEAREREVFYEIDLAASKRASRLAVQVSQRQRRATGQWGKLKPLKLRPGRFDELDLDDDRTILSYLYGGAPDRSENGVLKGETAATVFRYFIPQELSERLLPLMCRTGRVRLLGSKEKSWTPLRWDDGEPWELAVRVDPADNGQWKLSTAIVRGDETLPSASVRLLTPGGLVLTEESIARLHDYHAFGWVRLLTDGSPVHVPDGEETELVDRLLDMPTLPRLLLPEQLRLEEVSVTPTKRVTIQSPSGRLRHLERLVGHVRFDYDGEVIAATSDRWAIVQRDRGRCLIRDRSAENRAWSELQDHGFRKLMERNDDGPDVEVAARDLGPAVRTLMELGWDVTADGSPIRRPADVAFRVKSGIDWFELHADLDFDGQTVPFPELLAALSRGETTVRLDDGSLGIIPEEWAQKFGLLAGLGAAAEDHMRFAPNQIALLDALLSAHESVQVDDKFAELSEKFRTFRGVEPSPEPAGFEGSLRTYQREGLGWLRFLQEFRLGGCLADDMGLGKTVQLLALLEYAKKDAPGSGPNLIVVPKSLLFNWVQECTRFTPDLKVLEYTGIDRADMRPDFAAADLVLTTYGTLRRDVVHLKDVPFHYVVLDEAQAIKNSGSQVAKAARLLRARHRVALSGTPIENHLGDLWSIFEFLNPGMLGRSSLFRMFTGAEGEEQNRGLLAQAMRPFILRRTKKQVAADLPDKLEETIYCDMTERQNELYLELRDHYRQSLLGMVRKDGIAKTRMHVLEALLRLRQAACHPSLLDHGGPLDESAKLDVLVPQLQELIDEGHKALVFSQFTSMLSIVREHLDAAGVTYEYLDGQTRDRKQRVERFQADPDCGAFLISLKAGGLGLNLTAADYVFLLDPWWNPAVEAQAIDRAHRLGQKRNVFAYRLIVRGTVEEKIAELQRRKRQLADGILEADANVLGDLSTEDLEMLLS